MRGALEGTRGHMVESEHEQQKEEKEVCVACGVCKGRRPNPNWRVACAREGGGRGVGGL